MKYLKIHLLEKSKQTKEQERLEKNELSGVNVGLVVSS